MSTTSEAEVDYFPIRILSELTGVNSVTLRAWERRYGLLKPFRTEKGHRLYCQADVERVNKILYWINQGVAVGKVKVLLQSDPELVSQTVDQTQWPTWQEQFIDAVLVGNQVKWEQMFQEASKQYPIGVLLQKGLLPILIKLRHQNDAAVARLCLQSSLVELILGLRLISSHTHFEQSDCLILSLDHSSLMARLLAWSLSGSKQTVNVIEGVRTIQDVLHLINRFNPEQLIVMAESVSQNDAEKWLAQLEQQGVSISVIGAGFWLAGKVRAHQKGIHLYSDLSDYIL